MVSLQVNVGVRTFVCHRGYVCNTSQRYYRVTRAQLTRLGGRLTRFALTALSVYYPCRAINYRFLTPNRLGPELFDKQVWYFAHVIAALAVLVGAPLQFMSSLRTERPGIHRLVGRDYVGGP